MEKTKPGTIKCFICEKELQVIYEDNASFCIDRGGSVQISMGYGSEYDQLISVEPIVPPGEIPLIDENTKWKRSEFSVQSDKRLFRLLSCLMKGAICDKCLEAKQHLLRGYFKGEKEKYEQVE